MATAAKQTKTRAIGRDPIKDQDDDISPDASMDADGEAKASPDQLAKITAAAADLKDNIKRMEWYEQKAEEHKKAARMIATETLPALMDEAGVPELTLQTGETVTRDSDYFVSIAKPNMMKVIEWLDAHNYGAIAKSEIIIAVDRSKPKVVKAFKAALKPILKKFEVNFQESGSIHPQTLKAFGKESIIEQRVLCSEISIHVQPIVKLKVPKEKKAAASVVERHLDKKGGH